MQQESQSQCAPSYRLMTPEQVQQIHQATLDLLENVGVRVMHTEGVRLLADAGCRVEGKDLVHIPAELVEDAIRSAPSSVTIYNRKGEEAMRLEGDRSHFGLGTDLIYTADLRTGETRSSRLEDVANASRMVDYCKNIDFTASFALPDDVPVNSMYMQCFKTMVENTTKPIFFTAGGKEDLEYILEIAETVTGGREALRRKPFLIHYSEPTAPLTHSYGAVNKLLLCAERGVPICYPPGSMLGGAYPVTLAAAITQANAEALSGLVMHQLKGKGSPIISGWAIVALDMRTTVFLYGSPEMRLANSAFADMFEYYRLPMWSTVGSDANTLDAQGSFEIALGLLMAVLDGANLIHDVGYLGQGKLGNPASILMGDELISYVKRVVRGFEISPDALALDMIARVGPGGHYLSEEHTIRHHRKELWRPRVANRENMDIWVEQGSKTYEQRLVEEALKILDSHQPEPLPEPTAMQINEIAARADEALAKIEFTA